MSSSSLSNQSLHNQASPWSCLSRCSDDGLLISNLGTSSTMQQRSKVQPRDQVDDLLMSDFKKLSIDEQAKVLDDIYSAGSELKENPEMVDTLLTAFERKVEHERYPIYELALRQDRSYLEDPSFRLIFLRANMYDVDKAVKQMINFLQEKAKYFGADNLARDITLDDLTPSDLKLLLSGVYHIQDGTDRNGRVIVYVLSNDIAEDVDSQIRVLYYFWFNILTPMHSVQKKGVVAVVYNVMNPDLNGQIKTSHGMAGMSRFLEFVSSLPLRSSALHFCRKASEGHVPVYDTIIQFLLRHLPKSVRERFRFHSGSPIELQYKLATYGIPQDTFPVDKSGNLREGIRNAWFYKHMAREGGATRCFASNSNNDGSLSGDEDESSEDPTAGRREEVKVDENEDHRSEDFSEDDDVIAPPPPYSDQDVLLGRGYNIQNRPGNAAFREFLAGHQEMYDSSRRGGRREIARNLTRVLMGTGVRFWQKAPDGDTWIETDFDEVVGKVAQMFRSARKTIR